jgi:hypothetical protein
MDSQFLFLLNNGVSALCRRDQVQICHMCDRVECGDNTNPIVKRIKELEAHIKKDGTQNEQCKR